ncbi:MAG: phosphoribosylformylglycinamidine synthase subunit PurQ, partial [Nanoarchaeota archaeon]
AQQVTLTHNDCGVYRVGMAKHCIERPHFAFEGIDDDDLWLWCRHGEGKIQYRAPGGLISAEDAADNRNCILQTHVLLRYIDPTTDTPTQKFPHNPNGSEDAIAGLVSADRLVFGHMAHTEVSVYASRDPRWFAEKDDLNRMGFKAAEVDDKLRYGVGMKVFENIVRYVSKG